MGSVLHIVTQHMWHVMYYGSGTVDRIASSQRGDAADARQTLHVGSRVDECLQKVKEPMGSCDIGLHGQSHSLSQPTVLSKTTKNDLRPYMQGPLIQWAQWAGAQGPQAQGAPDSRATNVYIFCCGIINKTAQIPMERGSSA